MIYIDSLDSCFKLAQYQGNLNAIKSLLAAIERLAEEFPNLEVTA